MTDLEEIVRELKPSVLIGAAAIPKVNYFCYELVQVQDFTFYCSQLS